MEFTRTAKIEWPTVLLICSVYCIIGALVWNNASLPWWFILPIGSCAACLHSSLQHEVLHCHPTRNRVVNEILVFLAPHLWLPYGRYRDTHLAHHNDVNLTCPLLDPESYYVLPEKWSKMGAVRKALFQFNNTLCGRMLIGPAVGLLQFWPAEIMLIVKGRRNTIGCWGQYFVSIGLVISFVVWCGMPIWNYVLLIAYPAISLALVRSFCEHQAAEKVGERTIVVEASWFWSLLYLNNNLHIAHHDRPNLPWYKLPAYYRAQRTKFLEKNNNYVMRGYQEIFKRYFFSPKEPVAHPNLNWISH